MNGEAECKTQSEDLMPLPDGETVSEPRVVTARMGDGRLLQGGLNAILGSNAQDKDSSGVESEVDVPYFLRSDKPETVLAEAERIVYGDREETYGHPSKNFDATAALWQAHLKARYGVDIPLDYEDVAWMMVQLKQARSMHQYKRDNFVDACGYIACIQKVKDFQGE